MLAGSYLAQEKLKSRTRRLPCLECLVTSSVRPELDGGTLTTNQKKKKKRTNCFTTLTLLYQILVSPNHTGMHFSDFIASSACVHKSIEHADDVSK